MMLSIIVFGIIGAMLGLRFKVLILVPVVSLAVLGTALIGIASRGERWSIVGAAILIGTTVQVGYLIGVASRAVVVRSGYYLAHRASATGK
jgi:hypothetical protein